MTHPARPPRVIRHADIDSNKLGLARRFRQAPTAAEAAAWQILRDRAIFGLKFRPHSMTATVVGDRATVEVTGDRGTERAAVPWRLADSAGIWIWRAG